jgi:DNA-3-methyladenine glycosylase II
MSVAAGLMSVMETFTMVPRGPFSLASSIRFLEGFTPAAYASVGEAVLDLAFPAEGSWETVGVRVRQDGGAVTASMVSLPRPGPGGDPGLVPRAGRA